MTDKELIMTIGNFLSNDLLWLYFILIILAFYLILVLFTWSFRRPLNFLGVPSIIVGILLIFTYFIMNLIPISESLLKIVLSSVKPILHIGLLCFTMGVIMLVLSKLLSKFNKKKDKIISEEENNITEETTDEINKEVVDEEKKETEE